jgi:hypothetical protein
VTTKAGQASVACVLGVLGVAFGAAGLAARLPTPRERAAIIAALPADIRATPAACLSLDIRVSRNGRYAWVGGTYPRGERRGGRCSVYGRNGLTVLKKRQSRWRIVYVGSVDPPCVLRIPRDLTSCRPLDTRIDVALGPRIASFEAANDPTLAGAIRALGVPSSCRRVPGFRSFASVTWSRLGLRMVFGTYGPIPARGPCAAAGRIVLDSAIATGRRWRTGRGLRVGDPVARLRRLYPRAHRRRFLRGLRPLDGWWLVVRLSRVPDRHFVPTLLATARGGRVTGLVVTAELEGE